MEADQRKTLDDLLVSPEERIELIDCEIVRRPMVRSEHGIVQGNTTNWSIWPEDRVLIAHAIDGDSYRVIKTISGESRARIPPFDSVELDLAYILGD